MPPTGRMRSVPIGSTGVHISPVGIGTCQLRLIPIAQAVATIRAALDAGVNWFHASPDYQDADELVANEIAKSGYDAFVLGDGSGTMEHFTLCYERAIRLNGGGALPMWGISCIDDQEFVGHDVWGPNGMVEFLLRERAAGRIRALYCTTHGTAERVKSLLRSGVFDAIMLAWNPLGFHVLSSFAESEGKDYEDLRATHDEVFPLAEELGVSLIAMKSLAGGLLTRSEAFPPRALLTDERVDLSASDVLRYVLSTRGVSAVVPGAATPAEAREDALAGHGPAELPVERRAELERRVTVMRTTLCSRCGECEPTCSQALPISWLFKDAYMWLNPADTFDASSRLDYRHLLGKGPLGCHECKDQSCLCPAGIDIPRELPRAIHELDKLDSQGLLPLIPEELDRARSRADADEFSAIVVQQERPEGGVWRLWIENSGTRPWIRDAADANYVFLQVTANAGAGAHVPLRADCHPGERVHIALVDPGVAEVSLALHEPRTSRLATLAASPRTDS